ncbi:MAG: AMP-binding protein, partial [Sutterellaceae bacterium]|nr:AMP-binding protein [Sutterellaceae bacterium]
MTSANYVYFSEVLTRPELDELEWCVCKNQTRTFGELAVAVNSWKKAFQKARVRRVAIYFSEIFDSAAALLGALAAGVVAVLPADTTKTTSDRLADGLVDACAGEFSAECAMRFVVAEPTNEPCRDIFDDQAKLIELFTSGSTGQPSLIVKKLRQLFIEVESIEKRQSGLGIDPRGLVLSTVSQQHIYGLLFFLMWPLASGRRTWHTRITAPEEVIRLASQEKACSWVSSPAHLKRLPDHPDWVKVRGRLQSIYSSGGPLSEEGLRRTIELTGLSPQELLGSSESGGIAIRQRKIAEDGSITDLQWHALPSVQWKCEDGLLVIKSPQLGTDDWEVTPDRIEPLPEPGTFMHLGRADR